MTRGDLWVPVLWDLELGWISSRLPHPWKTRNFVFYKRQRLWDLELGLISSLRGLWVQLPPHPWTTRNVVFFMHWRLLGWSVLWDLEED